MSSLEGYAPFVLFVTFLTLLGAGMLGASAFLGPKGTGKTKYEPWECGVERLQTSARERFAVPFYLVAILFILFDLETVFLFPWAVVMKGVAAESSAAALQLFVEVLVFVGVLGVGLLYVWKRRGLEWD